MAEEVKSTLKSILDWRSKAFWGVTLGVLSIVIEAAMQFEGLPAIGLRIVQFVLFLFTLFGVTDAAKQEKAQLIERLQGFITTSPAVGVFIGMLGYLADKLPEMSGIPNWLAITAQSIGLILGVMGVRKVAAQARANMDSRNQEAIEKYRHLLQ